MDKPGFSKKLTMKKNYFLLIIFCLFASFGFAQNLFSLSKGKVSFYSYAPIENIEAHTNQFGSMINSTNREIAVIIPIRNFKFEKQLMQDHFNEKYMESEKFPKASFKGTLQQEIDWSLDSTYDVSAIGILTIHGVEKEMILSGKMSVMKNEITIEADFKVALKDFNIVIPKLLFENLAEVIDVKILLTYLPYQKK